MAKSKQINLNAKQLKEFNLRYWLNTRRQLVLAGIFVLGSVLMVMVGIWPQIQKIFELRAEWQSEQESLARLQNKVQALERADTLQLVDQADEIDELLPSKKPLLEMLSSLSQAADEAQVTFTDIEVRPGEISTESAQPAETTTRRRSSGSTQNQTKKKFEQLDLNLTIEGELNQVSLFIERIELLAPLINVTSISLSEQRQTQDTDTLPFEAELTLTVYYFTQPIAAAIEAPLPTLDARSEAFLAELPNFTFPAVDQSTTIRGGGLDDLFNVEPLDVQ